MRPDLAYLAPELLQPHHMHLNLGRDDLDNPSYAYPFSYQSDLWAFGCLIYEMAEGKPPFEGANNQELVRAILHKGLFSIIYLCIIYLNQLLLL